MPESTPEDHISPPTSHHIPSTPRTMSRWVAPAALVVSLIAAGAAGWALLRPAPDRVSHTAEPPAGDPKSVACEAYKTVSSAVALQTHGDVGTDPAAVQAVAANARLAMAGGAAYLYARTGPDTPADLADAIHSFANGLQDIAMNALAGAPNDDPAQAARLRDAEATNTRVAELCK